MPIIEPHKVIFIGPMKTGTTWVYDQIANSVTPTKEIYFPDFFFRGFVYRKYVRGSRFLIWPYLLHNMSSFKSLIKILNENNHTYEFVVSCRPRKSWLTSRQRFFARTGSGADARSFATKDLRQVLKNLRAVRKLGVPTTYINIFNPGHQTLSHLQRLLNQDRGELENALASTSYATVDLSILPTRRLAKIYFRLKPFFPSRLQSLRRANLGLTVNRAARERRR